MLLFRIICALMLAWAANWSLSRGEADALLLEIPEMVLMLPLGAAIIGYFNLAVRQGWGFIVAFANGVWAGVLALIVGAALYVTREIVQGIQTNVIQTFDNFLSEFSATAEPLWEVYLNIPLLLVVLGASAVVGVVTELLHWILVRFRQKRTGQGARS